MSAKKIKRTSWFEHARKVVNEWKIELINWLKKQLKDICSIFIFSVNCGLSLSLFLVINWFLNDADKSTLDTFIVIISLLSLILNNIFQSFNVEGRWNNVLSGMLNYFSRIFATVSTIAFVGVCLFSTESINNLIYTLVCLYFLSGSIFAGSKILLKKGRENLFYAIWWLLILVLYVIKLIN